MRDNLAYDLSRYENAVRKTEAEPKRVIKDVKKTASVANSASTLKLLLYIVAAGVMLCAFLYGKAEETSLQAQIAAKNKEIDIVYSENVRMYTELEGRTSISKVEDYAENVLGLQKLDKSQIEYVQLNTDNVVEINESESNIFVTIKNKFYEILEYLEG
ncbi:MAG: hypothetical protein E7507_06300 [Ruminococcus sp.]|nr:hypothetical protein [Ruminococcus sp.]